MLKLLKLSNVKLEPREVLMLAAIAALFAVALFGPAVMQPAHQHAFADGRAWGSIPNALDVLSNLAFAAWGMAGLVNLCGLPKRGHAHTEYALAALFFTGLVCTAAASCWYHLQPDDAGLGVDRLGMAVAFASLLGLAVSGSVSHRAGVAMAAAVLLLGSSSIWLWLVSGNVLPWLVIQFGGMALVVLVALIKPRPGALAVRWGLVVVVYAIAKLLELGDHEIFTLTGEVVSGHSLKHMVASLAAWPVLHAVAQAKALRTPSAFVQSKNSGRIQSVSTGATAI